MFQVFATTAFRSWLTGLSDEMVRGRIAARIRRLEAGHFGDVKPVGGGISEVRLHFGAGYRVYFVQRGSKIIVLLTGGQKSRQRHDIERAKAMLAEVESALPWLN